MEEVDIFGVCNYESEWKNITKNFQNVSELVRELYSNSIDARMTLTSLRPRAGVTRSMLIWCDDGKGMDTRKRTAEENKGCNGNAKTSIESYFHIGNSTQEAGKGMGQFSHGAKLVMSQADVLFCLLTRTAHMEVGTWFLILSSNVSKELFEGSLKAKLVRTEEIVDLVRPKVIEEDDSVQRDFGQAFDAAFDEIRTNRTSTLQLFLSSKEMHTHGLCDTDPTRQWPKPRKPSMVEHPLDRTKLVGCLRFGTRHGSIFSDREGSFLPYNQAYQTYGTLYESAFRRGVLRIHSREEEQQQLSGGGGGGGGGIVSGYAVPYGFPYIPIKVPGKLHARFGPTNFFTGTQVVSVLFFIDSLNSRLEYWEPLMRCNSRRCGVDYRRYSGIVLATEGTPIVKLQNDRLDLIACLPTCEECGSSNLTREDKESIQILFSCTRERIATLFLDIQNLRLLTSRNDIPPQEYDSIRNNEKLLVGLANTFADYLCVRSDRRQHHQDVLHSMIQSARSQRKNINEASVQQNYQLRHEETLRAPRVCLKRRMDGRGADIGERAEAILDLLGESVCMPLVAHEMQLQHLYAHYGCAVRRLAEILPRGREEFASFHRCSSWWWRVGLIFNGMGVDYQIFPWDRVKDGWAHQNPNEIGAAMLHAEVKLQLGKEFNHPFQACDLIICTSACEGDVITDCKKNTGCVVYPTDPSDPLHGIGCYLKKIQYGARPVLSRTNASEPLEIPILLFRPLLSQTFGELCRVDVLDGRSVAKKARSRMRL